MTDPEDEMTNSEEKSPEPVDEEDTETGGNPDGPSDEALATDTTGAASQEAARANPSE